MELKQIRVLKLAIKQLRQRASELRQKAFSLGSMSLNKDKVQTSPKNRLEDQIAEYMDMEYEAEQRALELERLRNQLIVRIHQLDDTRYINVLYKYYVQDKRLFQIAREMNYSYDRTKHLIREAEQAYYKH
jgi:hypothetical protein